jgi:hypothetical protein
MSAPHDQNQNRITRRVVLHRNGDPIHFDVTVDFERIACELGYKAEQNRSYAAVVAGGAVKVEYVQ